MCKLCTISLVVVGLAALVVLLVPGMAPADGPGCGKSDCSYTTSEVGMCPVSGKPGNAAYSMKVGARTLYFCDEAHMAEFRSNPMKYLKQMHAAKSAKAECWKTCPVTGAKAKVACETASCDTKQTGKLCCGECGGDAALCTAAKKPGTSESWMTGSKKSSCSSGAKSGCATKSSCGGSW